MARIEQNKIEAAKADRDQAEQQRQAQEEQEALKLIAIFASQAREEWRTVETNKLLMEVKKLKDDAAQLTIKLQNSEAEKPRLFGRKEWEKNHAELEFDVSYANKQVRDAETGINWKLGTRENPNQFEHDGIQRLKTEHPDLYKARCDARDERRQDEARQKQARELEQQKDRGNYR